MTNTLLANLHAALETAQFAEERIKELREEILKDDVPREWTFSHGDVSTLAGQQLGRRAFLTVIGTRREIEAKLREAVRALPFDRSECPLDVRSTATCKLTGESVKIYVHLEQDEPACERPEGHEWAALMDEADPEDFPGGRKFTEGCPHCDGQRATTWPLRSQPTSVVNYEVPHYTEGWVARELLSGNRPYNC